ncbi:MAG: EAL domain-containing protein [Pseudomonadota bacterium]|nr:EAL domain-containing protein [Pseudomonadota bacterium]
MNRDQQATIGFNADKKAAPTRADSPENLRDTFELLNRSGNVFFTCDAAGRFINVSRSLEEISEYDQADLTQAHFADLVVPEDFTKAIDLFRCALDGDYGQGEIRVLTRSGKRRWLRIVNMPVCDEQGTPGVFGLATNVTELRESQARLEHAQQIAQLGHWYYDLGDRKLSISAEVSSILGIPQNDFDLRYKRFRDLIHAEDRPRVVREYRNAVVNRSPFELEFRVVRRDGQVRWVRELGEIAFGGDGRPKSVAGTLQDITRQRQTEDELRLAAKALASTGEGVIIADRKRRVVSVNAAVTRITGCSVAEIKGQNLAQFADRTLPTEFYEAILKVIDESGYWQGELRARRKNGELFPVLASGSVVRDDNNLVAQYVFVFNDISTNKELERRLEYLAHRDMITGLPNRTLFLDRLERAVNRAERLGGRLGVLIIDLDHFKTINDSLGHDVGDRLLRKVAERFQTALRESDSISHTGGDEFAVLVDDNRDTQQLALIAESLLDALSHPFEEQGRELFISASIGLSSYPDDSRDMHTLLRHAEIAMYQAKQQRHSYQFCSPGLTSQVSESLHLANSLRHALRRDEFVLYYQPIYDIHHGNVVGTEALIRWQHPERGLLAPHSFIPLAEQFGLIGAIGEWVLQQASAQCLAWESAGGPPVRMSVNLSAQQFNDPALAPRVADIVRASRLNPGRLVLEITESTLMKDPARIGQTLRLLHQQGVEIAIDDFGTGYSSLSYLKHFPFDYLKIDRSFTHGVPDETDSAIIVESIIALGQKLGLEVVGEGVESLEQSRFLASQGCRYAQGFLMAPPLDAETITRQLLLPQGCLVEGLVSDVATDTSGAGNY